MIGMKNSLKELIDGLHISDDECRRFKFDTDQFIEEARKGQNWSEWKKDIFEQYFEKKANCVANLGNGQMGRAEKAIVKEHWMELAPHLKAIAESQDIPLWDEYKAIRSIIKKHTNKNLNVATNRMLACLQPKLLCTECDITRINKLVDYLRNYTDAQLTDYDPVCWEKASYSLLNLIKSVEIGKPYGALFHISWMLLEECKSRYAKPPKRWLVFANRNKWHHAEALHEIGFINWTMKRVNFSIGDLVYLFMSDERRIRFLTMVTAEKCERGDIDYMIDEDDLYPDTYKLELVAEAKNEELKEDNLLKHGFKGGRSLQSPIYNNPELFEYILPFFSSSNIVYADEITHPELMPEGAKKEIVVNRYERSSVARAKCVAAHGCRCAVCGMDFEKMYGEIGRGFIHVHHIVPLSSIGKEYELDPINDLVPVCPNCHAMLHRRNPPYKPEELIPILKSSIHS